ncbi:MAG: hypothetical protein ACE37H_17945 [Phycisphaeraceae bacterium]
MAKRDQTPPYEIMRSRQPGSASGGHSLGSAGLPADSGASQPVPAVSEPAAGVPSRAPWWVGSSAPLVLRVPRGLALLAVVGVLGVIVLAYLVGSARGSASAKPDPEDASLGERSGPDGYFVSSEDGYEGTEVAVPGDPLTAERREPGLNYMRLIQSNEADCRKLAEFFASRGVAIQLVLVNNAQSCIAYAVKRGYRGDELDSESCKRYRQQLLSIGQQWKVHNGNRGTDLSTMYFELYNPRGND